MVRAVVKSRLHRLLAFALVVAGFGTAAVVQMTGASTGGAPLAPALSPVSAAPTGPPAPAGGWSVEYANGFGAPLGTAPGQDNTFFPNRNPARGCVTQQGHNDNEMENFTCGQTTVNPAVGMDLRCSYGAPPNAIRTGVPINYNCGEAHSQVVMPAGYNGFGWLDPYGSNRTVVAEIKVQFPPNFDSDPAFWGTGPYNTPSYGDEIDHFEGFGVGQAGNGTDCLNGNACAQVWTKQLATMPTIAVGQDGGGEDVSFASLGFNPAAAVHTYTVEYTGSTAMTWVDGKQATYVYPNAGSTVLNVGSHGTAQQSLKLTYAMRGGFLVHGVMAQDPVPTFNQPGQFHDMYVRSVAIYENTSANHAGIQSTNGTIPLIAPGTTVVGGPVTSSSTSSSLTTSTTSTLTTPTTSSTTSTPTSTSTTTTSTTTSTSTTSAPGEHRRHPCKYEHCHYKLESEHHGLEHGPVVHIRRSTGQPVITGGVAIR